MQLKLITPINNFLLSKYCTVNTVKSNPKIITNTFSGPVAAKGETTTGKLCGQWGPNPNTNCCNSTFTVEGIQMKNCDTYFVYYLKPIPVCNTQYCLQKG